VKCAPRKKKVIEIQQTGSMRCRDGIYYIGNLGYLGGDAQPQNSNAAHTSENGRQNRSRKERFLIIGGTV